MHIDDEYATRYNRRCRREGAEQNVMYIQESGMNGEMLIPNAGQCWGCLKMNKVVFQREQTALLAVTYHFEEKAKGLAWGPRLQPQP